MTTSDRAFEDRLAEVLSEPMSSAQRSALDDRIERALAAARPLRGRRLPIRRSLLLVALLLVVVPTLFGVTAALLRTEDPFGLADSAEFQREIDAAKQEVRLPPGRGWPDYLRADGTSFYSRGSARAWVENNAVCIWLDEWLDARRTGHSDREGLAASTIAAIPSWPSWNSAFWTQSVRDHLRPVIDAVRLGQAGVVADDVRLNCQGLQE